MSFVYRSVAVPLPNDGLVERFARHWVLEAVRVPEFAQRKERAATRSQGPVEKYTPETAPLTRGLYRLRRIIAHEDRRAFEVLARCMGQHCGGRERMFTAHQWCSHAPTVNTCEFGCNKCARNQPRVPRRRRVLSEAGVS